jgi:HK97 family phage prohead protease
MAEDWMIRGLATRFNVPVLGGSIGGKPFPRPQILRPGCFARHLRNGAIVDLLLQHEGGPHGENISDTDSGLFISETSEGLAFSAWANDTIFAKRVVLGIIAGTLRECSVGWHTEKARRENGCDVIVAAELTDITIARRGACPGTRLEILSPRQLEAERLERSARFLPLTKRNDYASVY